MHPLIPAGSRVRTTPTPACLLDGLEIQLTGEEADRLTQLTPRLTGSLTLDQAAYTADDATLIQRLHKAGVVFDVPVINGTVPVDAFCDYLYARITRWRSNKRPSQWPWRDVIATGRADTTYLQGILIENYHYVRAAAIRQSPLLSHAAPSAVFDLVRDFVTDEAAHERYFLTTLTHWGLPRDGIQRSTPLAGTALFIALQYRLAHLSVLDYLAGSAVLEVDPQIYAHQGDPYAQWETIYSLDPGILAPVRQHIHHDVTCGHAQLFRNAAQASWPGTLPADVAIRAVQSARTVFQATRIWQREMFEHYQLHGGPPGSAGL